MKDKKTKSGHYLVEVEIGITSFLGQYSGSMNQDKKEAMKSVFQKLNEDFHSADPDQKQKLIKEARSLVDSDGEALLNSLKLVFSKQGVPADLTKDLLSLDLTLGIYRGYMEPAFRVRLWIPDDFHTPPLLQVFANFAQIHGQEEFHVSRVVENVDLNRIGSISKNGVMFVPNVSIDFSHQLQNDVLSINDITAIVKQKTVEIGIDGMTVRYPQGFSFYLVPDPSDLVSERKIKANLFLKQMNQILEETLKYFGLNSNDPAEKINHLITYRPNQVRVIKIFGHDDYRGSASPHVSPYADIHDELHDAAHLLTTIREA